jgi:UDP-N-acetylglucosamine 2-epimerase (non-hydrolysing)
MIHVIIGTKAQLIKMAPLLYYFQTHAIPYHYISTGQHQETMADIHANFAIKAPDTVLYAGRDITSVIQMAGWGARLLFTVLRHKQQIFPGSRASIVLVHGDTFSTLLGALMAKLAGLKVGHVESGLRSFNWFHPFPEEITRILTFKLSDYFFCPSDWALNNLAKTRGEKINTHANTLYEALQLALPAIAQIRDVAIPKHPYVVVTLHRYENVYNQAALERIVGLLEKIATYYPLLFILHKPTALNLKKFSLYERLAANPRIEFRPRYDYFRFIKLLLGAAAVVSDGGSNQEECYYLGKPVILLRQSTERTEGLGRNCVLSQYDPARIAEFFENLEKYTQPPLALPVSPCQRIAEPCQVFAEDLDNL